METIGTRPFELLQNSHEFRLGIREGAGLESGKGFSDFLAT